MLETVVILFAVLVAVAIIGLFLYAARQADLSLERRVQDAEAGGRPLSLDERSAVRVRGVHPIPPDEDVGGPYARYRRRNALTKTHARLAVWLLGCMATMAAGAVLASDFGAGFG